VARGVAAENGLDPEAAKTEVPVARTLALGCLALAGALACTTPCREGESLRDRRQFEHDHERCELQTRREAGIVAPGDYESCMRGRGWCSAPEWD
jgi:hypothetical protein